MEMQYIDEKVNALILHFQNFCFKKQIFDSCELMQMCSCVHFDASKYQFGFSTTHKNIK